MKSLSETIICKLKIHKDFHKDELSHLKLLQFQRVTEITDEIHKNITKKRKCKLFAVPYLKLK